MTAVATGTAPAALPGWRRRLRTSGVEAVLRLGACALVAALEAAWGLLGDWTRPADLRRRRREARRERAAARLARALGALRGAFVKAGQFASLRHDVLPPSVTAPLASLQDRVRPLPFAEVRAAVERELGAPLETHFAGFETDPIGTASVAQVHRARLAAGGGPGPWVAVKVQHPWLEASLPADLAVARRALAAWLWWTGRRPDLDLGRLFDEFAAGLRDELDFEHEARVAGEIARNLADDPRIVVPRVIASHTTRRVLTMTWHRQVPLTDPAAVRAEGIEPREVLEIVARAYARQVFVDGLFHADPHPGNLYLTDPARPGGPPRVLFVDFGLSKRLAPELRRELRLGMYALLQRDSDAFLAGMQRMGMVAPGAEPGVRAAVAGMFERLGGAGPLALGLAGSRVLSLKDEAKALLQQTPGLQLPNDLLLYAKTLSYLFALGRELDPEVDLMQLCLPYLLRFLAARDEGLARAAPAR